MLNNSKLRRLKKIIHDYQKVIVAFSGGVDSSIAALLLKQAGHNVTGGGIIYG